MERKYYQPQAPSLSVLIEAAAQRETAFEGAVKRKAPKDELDALNASWALLDARIVEASGDPEAAREAELEKEILRRKKDAELIARIEARLADDPAAVAMVEAAAVSAARAQALNAAIFEKAKQNLAVDLKGLTPDEKIAVLTETEAPSLLSKLNPFSRS